MNLENQLRAILRAVSIVLHTKAELPCEVEHLCVSRENVRDDALELFLPANLDQPLQQLSSDSLSLPVITDQ